MPETTAFAADQVEFLEKHKSICRSLKAFISDGGGPLSEQLHNMDHDQLKIGASPLQPITHLSSAVIPVCSCPAAPAPPEVLDVGE